MRMKSTVDRKLVRRNLKRELLYQKLIQSMQEQTPIDRMLEQQRRVSHCLRMLRILLSLELYSRTRLQFRNLPFPAFLLIRMHYLS